MLMPHYDKRRALTGGKADVITRYTDAATALLFKAYLIFVRPFLQVLFLHEKPPAGEKILIESLLTMGQIRRDRVSSALSTIFIEDAKLGMNLST